MEKKIEMYEKQLDKFATLSDLSAICILVCIVLMMYIGAYYNSNVLSTMKFLSEELCLIFIISLSWRIMQDTTRKLNKLEKHIRNLYKQLRENTYKEI